MKRGEIWWASLPEPRSSEPGFRRPVLIVQDNAFTESRIRTVIVAIITSNLHLANAPGNVLLRRRESKLAKDSVVNVSQVLAVSKSFFTERVGRIPPRKAAEVDAGLRLVLSL